MAGAAIANRSVEFSETLLVGDLHTVAVQDQTYIVPGRYKLHRSIVVESFAESSR